MTIEQEPTNNLLCYNVRHYLLNAIAVLEGLQHGETLSADKQRLTELATKEAIKGLEAADKLFKALCVLDPWPLW